MEFREINTFLEIAKQGSFSKAASVLGYTQAAVTIQIRQLEKELGVRLFDRIGKKVTLTHQGVVFSRYASRLMTDLSQVKYALKESDVLTGKLRIGAIESVCASILPGLIGQYHRLHPQVSISIRTDSPDLLLEWLNRNELDLVFLLDKRRFHPHWIKALDEPDRVIFVTSADSPLAGQTLALWELIRHPLILTEKNASYRSILEQHLASLGLEAQPFLEIGNTEFIIQLLKTGAGISFLPEFTVREDLAKGTLSQIQVPGFTPDIWKQIVYHKDKWVSREMEAFIRLALRMESGSQESSSRHICPTDR